MKNRINLYHKEFRPRFELISFANLLFIASLVSVIMLSIYAWRYAVLNEQEARISDLNAELSLQQTSLAQLTNDLAVRAKDPELAAHLQSNIQRLAGQQALLQELSAFAPFKQQSFSALFDALADASIDSLWLTEFSVAGDDIRFRGELAAATSLPLWLRSLSNTAYFQQRQFSQATVARSDNTLSFELGSQSSLLQSEQNEELSDD